jgi:hypothetical protein
MVGPRALGDRAVDLVGEVGRREQDLRARVAQHVRDLRPLQPIADRHQLGAELPRGVEQFVPRAAVVQRGADGIAGSDPGAPERPRQLVDPRVQRRIRAAHLAHDQRRPVGTDAGMIRKTAGCRIDRHAALVAAAPYLEYSNAPMSQTVLPAPLTPRGVPR